MMIVPEFYRVKSGDTLTRIAQAFGTTIAFLVQINGIRDPNRIRVGQQLRLRRLPRQLGGLSRKYEVGSRGPGAVSNGRGDPGGVSYGSYQLASRLGRPADFLGAEGQKWQQRFAGLLPGTSAFSEVWRKCAAEAPAAFEQAQHRYIERTHFEPQCRLIMERCGVNIAGYSRALQDVVWSTAVQHGPATRIVVSALEAMHPNGADRDFEQELIKAIYAERGRRLVDGRLAHFRSSSHDVQVGVTRRLEDERLDALRMLKAEVSAS